MLFDLLAAVLVMGIYSFLTTRLLNEVSGFPGYVHQYIFWPATYLASVEALLCRESDRRVSAAIVVACWLTCGFLLRYITGSSMIWFWPIYLVVLPAGWFAVACTLFKTVEAAPVN